MAAFGGGIYKFRMQDSLNQRVRGWTPFFVIVDSAAVSASFFCAYTLARFVPPFSYPVPMSWVPPMKEVMILILGVLALIAHAAIWLRDGHYMQNLLNRRRLSTCISQGIFIAVTLFVYLALWRDYEISRKVFLLSLMLLIPSLWIGKYLFMSLLKSLGARVHPKLRIIAVSDEASAADTRRWFSNKQLLGIHLCDVLTSRTDDIEDDTIEKELDEALEQHQPNLVIWRLPTNAARTERLRLLSESHGTHLAIDLNPILGEMDAFQVAEYAFMKLVSLHRHPLVSPSHRFLKRVLDIAISLPVVLFILPWLCLGVAVLHRVFAPGPLFFKQVRSGADGQKFHILKFRTMVVNHGTEGKQARPGDKRLIMGGALLRKMSIDEIPQFLNVLDGTMSVVGPRPHMPEHDALFSLACHQYPMRQSVKPGLTGLAQVRGFRGPIDDEIEIRQRVHSDIEYCQNWSFGLDLGIIARTFFHVFSFHAKSC